MSLALAHPLDDPQLQAQYEAARALRAADDPEVFPEGWGEGRIFVSVAAFRDPECQKTLVDLFEKATHPERVSVGLIWQHDPVEDEAFFALQPARRGQVREMRFDWRDGLGVCWARFLAQALWRGEAYYLQIDSHMKFEPGWDEILIADLDACPSDKAILASAPPPYLTPGDTLSDLYPGVLRTDGFEQSGALRFTGLWLPKALERYVRMPFLLAGALFAPGRLIAELPYDPYAAFSTEEVTYALRAFTHGWDIYAAPRRSVWHQYKRDNRVKRGDMADLGFQNRNTEWTTRAFHRFNHMTGHTTVLDQPILVDLDLFDLGTERTLAEYEAWTGIDFRYKRITVDCARARFIPDIDDIASFSVPVLDDPAKVRPALVEPEEMRLREALSGWEVPQLAEELASLLIELDRQRHLRAGKKVGAVYAPDRAKLVADFSSWERYALACELAKLSWTVHLLNTIDDMQSGLSGGAAAAG
ncbi:GlcNAc-transferase family protein [Salinarimonas ramus]|uniref:Glycosyl transferase n=1 Tax=Salinarimonas ramus TaxID=690164 RepID=A0A917Q6S9_9HYPH|nr:GlcNAc-transferase family protein [Salinarimonas ramus]GGK31022.1 glycosyl transferase [Salinarimonas ramus]